MQKEDWQRIAKWIGWVYLPIIILAAVVFVLVEWNSIKLEEIKKAHPELGALATTTPN